MVNKKIDLADALRIIRWWTNLIIKEEQKAKVTACNLPPSAHSLREGKTRQSKLRLLYNLLDLFEMLSERRRDELTEKEEIDAREQIQKIVVDTGLDRKFATEMLKFTTKERDYISKRLRMD